MIKDSQLYKDYEKLEPGKLIEIIKGQQKLIQAFLNRGEELDRWLNTFPRTSPGLVLDKINELAFKHPAVLGKE